MRCTASMPKANGSILLNYSHLHPKTEKSMGTKQTRKLKVQNAGFQNDTELTTQYCVSPLSSHCFLSLQSSVPKKRTKMRKKRKKNWDPQRCKNRYTKPLSGLRSGQPTKQNQKRMPILVCSNKWFTATRCQPNCSLSHSSHILNASKPVVFWMPQRIWCFEIQNVRCVFKYLMNLDNVLCPYL